MAGRAPSFGRPALVALARAANLVFFLITATYCLLSYSPFAYQNLIRPHMIATLGSFVVWHHLWFWLILAVTALTVAGELGTGRGRWIGRAYLIVSLAVAVVLSVSPVLPQVENNARGLWLAIAALIWPLWLALYDHVATSGSFQATPSRDGRLIRASIVAALFVWASQLVAIPSRLGQTGDIPLTRVDIAFGITTSLLAHLAAFGAVCLVMVAALGISRRLKATGIAEYWLLVALSAAAATVVVDRLVFVSISFGGVAGRIVAVLIGSVLAAVWSSIVRRLAIDRREPGPAVNVWLGPLGTGMSWPRALGLLLLLVSVEHYALGAAATFDWNFLVQKLLVLAVWWLGFGVTYAALKETTPVKWTVGTPLLALAFWGGQAALEPSLPKVVHEPGFVLEFVLDGYVGLDTSYRLIRDIVWTEPPGSASFYRVLDANTLLERFDIAPVDNGLTGSRRPASNVEPNIFLFTVDSLRPDYLRPYNPGVAFTPAMERFAADSAVFTHAFTPYGGTGLSMPAIWAGAMMIHKQYVTPFQPMNTLERLLDLHGYQMWLSMDHITHDLLAPRQPSVELDRGRDEMDYDFCGTLGEIETHLQSEGRSGAPLFVHTRSLNLHVSKLRGRRVPDDPAYTGFHPAAAAAVRRIDGCFGGFLEFLKQHRLYDNSIIVLMSDHGDSLGDQYRWGHAMTLFSEVIRIPLIIHVPEALRKDLVADTSVLTFSTDVTPTLGAMLGSVPERLEPFYGISLVQSNASALSARRNDPQLLASSYGPVYAILSDTTQTLYIADAVNRRDYKYDISGERPLRLGITAEDRAANRQRIEQKLSELADLYHFSPEP